VVAPPPEDPRVDLPPGWADAPLLQEGDSVFLVGRAQEAVGEEAALAQARGQAQLQLVKALQAKMAGTPVGAYLSAHPPGELDGNLAPIVARLERQLQDDSKPLRTDADLRRKEAKVSGPVRYRVTREAFERAVAFYASTGEALGLKVGRFFPSLEASTRTEAELVVLASADGPAKEAGIAEGELLVAVDGVPVSSPAAFSAAVEAKAAGAVVLTLESAGTRRDVPVKLPRKAPGR
jgi:C-terminal processing protease CtpA/Prc